MAAQHLLRDLVRPNSRLQELTQTMKKGTTKRFEAEWFQPGQEPTLKQENTRQVVHPKFGVHTI